MIKIYAQSPNEKAVARVADVLRSDGVIVYPTDSVYAFGCSIRSPKAIERLRALSGKKGDEFSIVCPDLSTISAYARVDNAVFKVLKRNLPGPFTFVLNASGKVPDKFLEKRKTVGVRIPHPRRRAGDRRGARASARDRFGQGFGGGIYDRSVADRGALRLGGGGGDRRRLRSLRADDGRGLHGREQHRRVEGRNRRISLTGL